MLRHNASMPEQYLTGTPFTDWSTVTISQAVGKQLTDLDKQALAYYQGDHWQGSVGWGGPVPDLTTTSVEDSTLFMAKVAKAFTSANVLGECVDRHVSAVIGREPAWQFVPRTAKEGQDEAPAPDPGQPAQRPQRSQEVTDIEMAIIDWAERRNAHQYVLEAAADYAATGHGFVRLFVPPGLLEDGKLPTGLNLEEALDMVYIERLVPTTCGTAVERATMATGAFVQWDESIADQGGGEKQVKRSELQYLAKPVKRKRMTVLRAWENETPVGQPLELDLDGHLLMHELNGRGIVTEQLMQLQRSLNFSLTAMGNNNANAGFLERIISNSQVPVRYVPDPTDRTGTKKLEVKDTYRAGPGKTVWLTGHPITDEAGNVTGYTNPVPHFRDPSSPDSFTASLAEYRAAMYMETKQGHLLAQGDGSISGASRLQLRADFEVSLRDTRVAAEQCYRWMLTVLAKLAGLFSGQPTKFDHLRPSVVANVNTGPLTAEELQVIVTQYEKGLRSRESTMNLIGVDDPDAEYFRIVGEQPANPVSLDTLAALGITLLPEHVINLLTRAGFTVTPEQQAAIKAKAEADNELHASAAAARNRALNPQDEDEPPAPPADE